MYSAPAARREHRVHEQILPGVRRVGGQVRFADVVIHHTGYRDPALRQRKLPRDQRLVEMELPRSPSISLCSSTSARPREKASQERCCAESKTPLHDESSRCGSE